jgi:hypothetical protein
MGSAAVCLDAATKAFPGKATVRAVGALLIGGVAASITTVAIQASHIRLTNVDLTANLIAREAGPSDLVVVDNFFYSVSFARYYHGKAPFLSVPSIADRSLHRWDLLKECMTQVSPTKSVLDRIDETLKNGHTVFVVGFAAKNRAGSMPPDLPPAPLTEAHWAVSPYLINWAFQVAYVVQTHALHGNLISVPCDQPLSEGETVHAFYVNGWKPPQLAANQ